MFVGREAELKTLEDLYGRDSWQMIVLYGRRRVGKTTLLAKFIEDKPAIFFSAQEVGDKMNLEVFSRKIFEFFKVPNSFGGFSSWNDAFDFLAERAEHERFILVIDEFPYAVEGSRGLASILQNVIDHRLKDTNAFWILCGSQIGFMENAVLGHKSPLFGRRTAQMRLDGFDYVDASRMLAGYGNEDMVRFYACIGGTPHYLNQVDPALTFQQNIANLFFRPSGYLYDEPTMLLRQELREPAVYNAAILAIAQGASRLNEIATKIGEAPSKVIKYLEPLMRMRILHREFPFGENSERSRKGIYRISDNVYRFWYRFVLPNRSAIEQGAGLPLFGEIQGELNAYIGRIFEEVCLQYMIRRNNALALPFLFTHSGRWWGGNPRTKRQEEIDLVCSSHDGKSVLFAECKWREESCDASVLNGLIEKSRILDTSGRFEDIYYCLFSKAGFTRTCKAQGERMGNVFLIGLDELFSSESHA